MGQINYDKLYDIISDWIYDNMYQWTSDGDYDYGEKHIEYNGCRSWNKEPKDINDMIEDLTYYITKEYEKRDN